MRYEVFEDQSDVLALPEAVADDAAQNPRLANVAPALGEIGIQPRTTLDLRLTPGNVRLGQKKMPFRLPKEQIDYSDYRYRFFTAVTASQTQSGEAHPELKPLQIWAAMGEEGRFPTELMIAVKRWLPTLTYRGKRLIEGNSKRGRGAAYWVNQGFFLNVDDRVAEVLPPQEQLPSPAEIYEAVRHLTQFDFALREHGVLEMEPGLEMELQAAKPDYSQLRNSGVDLKDFRAEAATKMSRLLTDLDYTSRYKKTLDKKSPEYGLLRYIYDMTPNERFFVERLLKAQVIPQSYGGELRLEAVDEHGMIIAAVSPRGITEALKPDEDAETLAAESQQKVSQSPSEDIIFDRSQQEQPVSGEIEIRTDRLEPLLEVIEAVVDETAANFLVSFNHSKTYWLPQIQVVFPNITVKKLKSAKQTKVINHRDGPLSLEDVVRITLHSDPYLRNIFRTRKYKDRIESIIQRAISENIKRVEAELNGWEE